MRFCCTEIKSKVSTDFADFQKKSAKSVDKNILAHLLKVCDSDKLALWNFQLQNYLITKAACHGSRSTFTQQDLGVQNVEPKETRRGYFEKRSEVNWWFIGATCVTQPITCTVEPFSSKRI